VAFVLPIRFAARRVRSLGIFTKKLSAACQITLVGHNDDNMATLEAMAAGLPVLGNCHPTSPSRHAVGGFLSNDPEELRAFARRLLRDPDLATQMGAEDSCRIVQRRSVQAGHPTGH
jgi:glycosyltransferase involved in cell wall biosynthesis